MAGTSNIYNATPEEIILAAIEKSMGITLQRHYLHTTITPLSGNTTRVTLTPIEQNGYSLYAEERSWYISKLNPTNRLPKDLYYSSSYPITLQSLSTFMSSSYGLQIRSGEWALIHEGVELVMDETASFERSLASTRVLTLKATAAHPIFSEATNVPLTVTKVQTANDQLRVDAMGVTELGAGEELDLTYEVSGGVAPYQIAVTAGVAPAALDPQSFSMKGRMTTLGNFDFDVTVTDDVGAPATVSTQVKVSMDEMLVQGDAPDIVTGQIYDHHYYIEGGMLPYRLVRVIALPHGLSLDDNAHLTGWADTGTHVISAIYEDALGHRSRIVDEITVTARDPDESVPLMWQNRVDWLELGGGAYAFPYHHGAADWTLSSSNYVVAPGLRGAGLKINAGYLVRDQVSPSYNHYAIAFWAKRGLLSTGGCLCSNFDGSNGLEVRIDDVSDERLRLTYWKDGQAVSIHTPEGVSVLSDTMGLVTIQIGGGDLTVHRNSELVAWTRVPTGPFITQQAMMIGRPPNLIAGYQWNGVLARVMTFKTRLYGDQLSALYNNGRGLEMLDTSDPVTTVTRALRFSSSSIQTAVNQAMRLDISVSGDVRRHNPVLYSGSIPPDTAINFSDANTWVVSGAPSQKGTYVSKWAVESSDEVATLTITITVV